MDRLIQRMKDCGWEMHPGYVTSPELGITIVRNEGEADEALWARAIEACIEVASGV